MQTILLHVQADDRVDGRVEDALAIARSCGAFLDVVHITPDDVAAVYESFGGIDPDRAGQRNFEEAEDALEARIRNELSNEDVQWDYTRVRGSTGHALASRAALSDLVVTGRLSHRSQSDRLALRIIGDLLVNTRAPVLIRGDEAQRFDPSAPAVIAWDGSFEVANVVAMGLNLLRASDAVHVVRVTEGGEEVEPGLYPLTRVLSYLSRHGIKAEYSRIAEVDGKVVPALLGFAEEKGATMLATGAYTHSRIGQRFFGGVTRSLLKSCPIALLMAH
ncbi:universal stress protein [Sphingomicrobium sp. XHP0239]|uniref:universal stress protein n=1 Tax=Sphingomicrobium maritimum TaxID=3133972 RepID=UPI0031CC54ED